MIDTAARTRLQQIQQNKSLINGMNDALQTQATNSAIPLLANIIQQIQDLNDKIGTGLTDEIRNLPEAIKKNQLSAEQLDQFTTLIDLLKKMDGGLQKLEELKSEVYKVPNITFPKETKVSSGRIDSIGKVESLPPIEIKNFPAYPKLPENLPFPDTLDIKSLPPVQVSNLQELGSYFNNLDASLLTLASKLKITIPDRVNIKDPVEIQDWDNLLAHIDEVNKGLNILINQEKGGLAKQVEVTNFPIPKIPTPVTNISINPLQGFVNTRANTVGTTRVTLPNYGQLFNRRSLQIYNNSSNTIYIGGEDVSTTNGIPVPANSYSSIIDAGYRMIIYGIAATGSNDIRTLEVSHDQTNNVQE